MSFFAAAHRKAFALANVLLVPLFAHAQGLGFYIAPIAEVNGSGMDGPALSGNTPRGFFFQAEAGAIIHAGDDPMELPAEQGKLACGLSFGWRFLLGNRFYIEPYIRGGYPYIAGGGVCAGIRF